MSSRGDPEGNNAQADRPEREQRQGQRPESDRAGRNAMNLHKCLAALLVLLALSGCAQVATEREQAPVPSYPHDNGPDRRGDMM